MIESAYDLSQKVMRLMNSTGVTYEEALETIKVFYEIELIRKQMGW